MYCIPTKSKAMPNKKALDNTLFISYNVYSLFE